MKTDIDSLMQKNEVDVLLVRGEGMYNPYMVYLTGGGHFSHATLIKKSGEQPILFHHAIERDEAAKTGLPTRSYATYPWKELLNQTNGSMLAAEILRYGLILSDLGISSGRVVLYGQNDLGEGFAIFSGLQKSFPSIEFTGYLEINILLSAMMTKSMDEIERIRKVGKISTGVMGNTVDFLCGHKTRNGVLINHEGEPLTVGDVKGRINLYLAQKGAETPEGLIFAIGRDSAVPHSCGNPADVMALGKTIIFDLYPSEIGGGYFYDMTRTWCLGYAPDEALKLHGQVSAVSRQIKSELKVGERFQNYQQRACELFEKMGHPSIQTTYNTENGYVHSLGHGVGLHIHEQPWAGVDSTERDILAPNTVFTIEPGLYYPETEIGVRLEDTLWTRPDGQFEPLAEYPLDLVLPVKS